MTIPRRLSREEKLRKRSVSKARILVVDDDERNLLAVTEVLRNTSEKMPRTSEVEAKKIIGGVSSGLKMHFQWEKVTN